MVFLYCFMRIYADILPPNSRGTKLYAYKKAAMWAPRSMGPFVSMTDVFYVGSRYMSIEGAPDDALDNKYVLWSSVTTNSLIVCVGIGLKQRSKSSRVTSQA